MVLNLSSSRSVRLRRLIELIVGRVKPLKQLFGQLVIKYLSESTVLSWI